MQPTTQRNIRQLHLKRVRTLEQAEAMVGNLLTDEDYHTLVNYDCDGYDADTGDVLFKLRKGVIPTNFAKDAYHSLREAARPTDNRASATNPDTPGLIQNTRHKNAFDTGGKQKGYVRSDGKISRSHFAKGNILSGVIGYYDRYPRFPYCRTTAFTQKNWDKFKKAYPIIKTVDDHYRELMPEQYAKQRALADITSPDFRIHDTAFTTITVNKNWQTSVHTDRGDFAEGFGNLVVLRAGRYTGGYFVLVEWGVAIDLNNCDLLLVDVHRPHGNTPIRLIDKNAERISLVMYYRENMKYCGTREQEREFLKHREPGSDLVTVNLNPNLKE